MKRIIISILLLFTTIPLVSPAPKVYHHTDRLEIFIDKWVGTPYRFGGVSKRGIDCSALVRELFRDVYNHQLPRTAYYQFKTVKKIQKKHLKKGDLVFFRSRGVNPWHVGLYLGSDMFLHSTTSLGVTVSCLTDAQYQRIFYAAGRITNIT